MDPVSAAYSKKVARRSCGVPGKTTPKRLPGQIAGSGFGGGCLCAVIWSIWRNLKLVFKQESVEQPKQMCHKVEALDRSCSGAPFVEGVERLLSPEGSPLCTSMIVGKRA